MSPVVCALGAIKFKIKVLWGMWSAERGARSKEWGAWSKEWGVRSKEWGARSKERGARSEERGARRSKNWNQCRRLTKNREVGGGGVCVYNHGLTGHKHISMVIVFCTWSEFLGCHRHQADVRTNTGYWI